MLNIVPKHEQLMRYGISVTDVQSQVATAMGGTV